MDYLVFGQNASLTYIVSPVPRKAFMNFSSRRWLDSTALFTGVCSKGLCGLSVQARDKQQTWLLTGWEPPSEDQAISFPVMQEEL